MLVLLSTAALCIHYLYLVSFSLGMLSRPRLLGPCAIANCDDCFLNPPDPDTCVTCAPTYYIDQVVGPTACASCPANCGNCVYDDTKHNDIRCTSCTAPYVATTDDDCCPVTPECLTCEFVSGSFTKCLSCVISTQTWCSSKCVDSCHASCSACNCDATDPPNPFFKCTACTVTNAYITSAQNQCQPCDSICLTCQTSNSHCLSCDSTNHHRVLDNTTDPLNPTCICELGFRENVPDCLPCSDGLCETCPGDICNKCKPGNFLDGSNCYPCQKPCTTCQTFSTNCLTCVPNSTKVTDAGTGISECVCNTGFYQTVDGNCEPCANYCQACSLTPIKCSSCKAGFNRQLNGAGDSCICSDGFYDAGTDTCSPCVSPCQNCSTLEDCGSCVAGLNREVVSQRCNCMSTFYDDGTLTCKQCIDPCLTCTYNDGTKCKSCLPGKFRVWDGANTCLCNDGYYVQSGTTVCAQCQLPCLECTDLGNGTQCTTCGVGLNRVVDSQVCVCAVNHYFITGVHKCEPCLQPCMECQDDGNGTQCTTCTAGLHRVAAPVGNLCPCLDNYYETTGQLICTACQSPCLECQDNGNGTQCTSCATGLFRVAAPIGNICPCLDKYFQLGADLLCKPCNYSCKTCLNAATECHSCDGLKFRTQVGNTCICMDNYFDNLTSNETCQPCVSPCQTCNSFATGTSCKTCVAGLFRSLSGTQCPCIEGYFDNGSLLCQKCYASCKSCVNAYTCLTCDTANNQVEITFSLGKQCVCATGFKLNSLGQCITSCPYDCDTCDANGLCLTCGLNSNRSLVNGRCMCNQEAGGSVCLQSCTQWNLGKIISFLEGPLNSAATGISGMTLSTQNDESIHYFRKSTIDANLKLGRLKTNKFNDFVFFRQDRITSDYALFGASARYKYFMKNNIAYLVLEKDNSNLDIYLSFEYASSQTVYAQIQQTKTGVFQTYFQVIQVVKLDTFSVVVTVTAELSYPTASVSYPTNDVMLSYSFDSNQQRIVISQMIISEATAISNPNQLAFGDTIIFMLEQSAQYACYPHQKNLRQVIRESHQLLLAHIPVDVLPIRTTNGQNSISQADSSNKFAAAGGAIIQLNGANIPYQSASYQFTAGQYQYSSVTFPDSLFFGLSLRSSFTSFSIQHNVAPGYTTSINAITYNSRIGTFKGYFVDIYGTTSVKTLVFGLDQGHTFNNNQAAGSVTITTTGPNVRNLYFYMFVQTANTQYAGYQNLFETLVKLILRSVEHCHSVTPPIRFIKEQLQTSIANLVPSSGIINLLPTNQGYFLASGTAVNSGKTAFEKSHIISTNLEGNVIYTNGFIVDGSRYFGPSTTYFTMQSNIFILAAKMNGVTKFDVQQFHTGGAVTCTQYQLTTSEETIRYQAFVSDCRWATSVYQIVSIFLIDSRFLNGVTLTQTTALDKVDISFGGLGNVEYLHYQMMVAAKSTALDNAAVKAHIDRYSSKILRVSRSSFPCDFQCATLNAQFDCATYRSGYASNPLAEVTAPQISDINNFGGGRCKYFDFSSAMTKFEGYKNTFDTYLKTKLPNRVLGVVANGYIEYDAYRIGKFTSTLSPTTHLQSPQVSQTLLTFDTPIIFGAQSKIYSYVKDFLSFSLIETNIDTIYIDDILNPDPTSGAYLQNTYYFNAFGNLYVAQILVTSQTLLFPNTYEIIVRPLKPSKEQLNIALVPTMQSAKVTIDQAGNPLLVYMVFADFSGNPTSQTVLQEIAKTVYDQLMDSVPESICICWGRYRLLTENCRCQSGYYPPTTALTDLGLQDCLPCDTKCKTCQISNTNCLSCPDGSLRELDTSVPNNFKCKCKKGYFDSGAILCVPCDIKCAACGATVTKCTECKPGTNRSYDGLDSCLCDANFFDLGAEACQSCHFSCLTCSGSAATQCLTCSAGSNRIKTNAPGVDGQCLCSVGFLESGSANCLACDYTCESCLTTVTSCQTCKPGSNRTKSGSTCPCNTHYYNILNQWDCAQCSAYCGDCTGPNDTQCINCLAGSNRTLSGTKCNCSPGYYKDAGNSPTCPQCHRSCQTCSVTSTQCLTCEPLHQRTYDAFNKLCPCNQGYFDDGINAACAPCSIKCRECQLTATTCLSCKTGMNRQYVSSTKECKCLPTFSDVGLEACQSCHYSCAECTSVSTQCTQCDSNGTNRLDQSGSTQTCPCALGFFDDGKNMVCQACHPSCKACSAYSVCTQCNTVAQFRLDQSGTTQTCPCQNGYYDNNISSICQSCHYSCQTCSQTSTNCTSCNTVGTNRITATGSCPCANGFFDSNAAICVACSYKCAQCSGSANLCTSCPSQRVGSSCECRIGYIENNAPNCFQCGPKCGTCTTSAPAVCLSCFTNRVNPPSCPCQDGFIEISGNCQKCPNNCQTCTLDGKCTSCNGDRINFPDCICPDGTFEDGVNEKCQVCFNKCATCSPTSCLTCLANRIMDQNKCVCPPESIEHAETPLCSNCAAAVISGQFGADLTNLIFTFPYIIQFPQTKKITAAKSCSSTFFPPTLQLLGQQPVCAINGQQLTITLGKGSTILPTSTISFRSDIILKTGCATPVAKIEVRSITFSEHILLPSFQLPIFTDPISLCEDLALEMRKVRVSGNRDFPIIQWSLVSMLPTDATVASYLQSVFTNANQNTKQSITIEKLRLSENGRYQIQLKAYNFRNQSFTAQTTFTTQSFEAPILNLDPNQKYVFGRWEDLAFTISFKHLSCYDKQVIEVYDALRINWTEIAEQRTPLEAPALMNQSQIVETDGMTFLNTLRIPAYIATIGSTYTLQVTVQLTNKPIQTSQVFSISIVSTPMQAYIEGGTRTQSLGEVALLNGFCRDPDLPFKWNEDPDITFLWSCINLVSGQPCTDSIKEPLQLNVTKPSQTFAPRVLDPYQPLQFSMVNKKFDLTLITNIILLVIETDLPKINVAYPSGYDSRPILLHEELMFNVSTDQNPDSLRYFCQILYDYNVVSVFKFKFLQVKFRLWDYFMDVTEDITQIQIKLAAKDPYHYMPSVATVNLELNIPPSDCKLIMTPTQGMSVTDLFLFTVSGCQDANLPLTYQYHLYMSEEILDADNKEGETIRKRSLTDPSESSRLQTVLPTPTKLDGTQTDKLVVMVSIYDSNYGMTNITKVVKLTSIQKKVSSGVDFSSILMQVKRSLKLDSLNAPTQEELPSLFIASNELSSLYAFLKSQPKKQTQMKPVMKQIYDKLALFQGKLTSKILEETLLSSLSSIGRTGITFEQLETSLLDLFGIKSQIREVTKLLTKQSNDLDYFTTQKAKSGGATSKYEDSIKALDNTILNSGFVTDTLFNAIKGNKIEGATDADINLFKTQIQDINKQVAAASLKRSIPNEKPRQFAGDQMGMQAYKSTPAEVTKLLSSQGEVSIFTEDDEVAAAPNDIDGKGDTESKYEQIEEDEIDYIKYFTEHPDLAKEYGIELPKQPEGETPDPQIPDPQTPDPQAPNPDNTNPGSNTNGGNRRRQLQKRILLHQRILQFNEFNLNRNNVTYRRLLVDQDPDKVKQYSVQMENYKTNPYLQDPKFKQTLSQNITNTTNTTQVSNFGTVNPALSVSENGNSQEIKELNGQSITLEFAPNGDANLTNATMECFSQGKDQWQTGKCKTKKIVDGSGQIKYACDCEIINPTTVISTLDNLVSQKLNSVFNANSLDIFLNIKFWEYAIFYVAIIFSGVYITLMVLGLKRDNEDFMTEIAKELEGIDDQMPEFQELKREFDGLLKTIKEEDQESKEQTLAQAQDYKQQLHDDQIMQDKANIKALAIASLQTNPVQIQKHDGKIDIKQKVVPQEDRLQQQIEHNKVRLDIMNAQKAFRQHDFMSKQRERAQGRAKNIREVIKNAYSVDDLAYQNGQQIKLKPLTLKLVFDGVMTLHRVLSIMMFYDDIISRPARFALVYSKTLLVLALSALFSGNFGPVYSVLISVLVSQVINVILTVITVMMKASPVLKFAGILFTIAVSGTCWFITIMLSAQMEQSSANAWAIQFLSTQFSDFVVAENFTIAAKLMIYPWAIKALHAPDGESNTLAHLVFIAVAQPKISKFFQVEEGEQKDKV